MTGYDRRILSRPSSGAVQVDPNDLFFSRTDTRGVIMACNHTFKRISGYEYHDLIGAPHRLVRHPDMPKGAFHLIWDRLKQGKLTGAFVKNLAKDGLHYWVFALMSPVDGGYLSVRLNASSEMLPMIQELYATLREAELSGGATPEESAQALRAALAAHGYPTYGAFMAQGLRREMDAREAVLSSEASDTGAGFDAVLKKVDEIRTETAALAQTFAKVQAIPQNMRILASQLETLGGPISAISSNYGGLSRTFMNWITGFHDDTSQNSERNRTIIYKSLFLMNAARLQEEMQSQFMQEQRDPCIADATHEIRILKEQTDKSQDLANQGLRQLANTAGQFTGAVGHMKRQVMGLSSTRMMCKIEGARLGCQADGLVEIIKQLDRFQTEVEKRLNRIDGLNRDTKRTVDMLVHGGAQTKYRSYRLHPDSAARMLSSGM
ncbi:PAS domain-containing protein [Actibacterium sp. 188UL27-1]|uniref:PAS domain-containing protein n=1 Tax=Actibacterium sp. 188UL27-1 TaxID=2786961 RepID=UPI00195DCDDF|nr:PAS domain-containing protein [Actibacterium sp. 188UL27-1]MBM7068617.1 PAS domain-containing protein [Actibacterium sp. 188UL27-1]